MLNLKFILSLIVLSLGVFSCDNSSKQKEDTVIKDSVLTSEDLPVQKLMVLFKNHIQLPFVVDSAFLARERWGDSLGTTEIQLLAGNWFKHDLVSAMEYDLKEFYKIDSIKASGTYMAWSEKLDIGMTKYANAYTIGKINLEENVQLLVWLFKTQSYEACPWSNTTAVYFTVIKHGVIGESFMLGENFGAGDPPVWMHQEVRGTLNTDGSFNMDWKEENDDSDGTESEIEKRHYEFLIQDGNIQLTKEDKGKPYMVPHPKTEALE